MSSRPRRATAGPSSRPATASAISATPSARRPRASLAAAAGATPRLAANLPVTPAGVDRTSWRKSLLDGAYRGGSPALALQQREQFVRGPASLALEGLCAVGREKDEATGDYGDMRLSEENKEQYRAFEALKRAYLSRSTFLSATALSATYPEALADPFSPLSSLIKLANLTTFLYLVLSSAPASDGSRPRTALSNLRDAASAFLNFIVPVDSQIHDGTLRMLVGLNCQAYLSAAANSRGPPPAPADFFSAPLSSYLSLAPTFAARDPLANRESSIRFNSYNADALALIERVGADVAVLETQWKWRDVALELRNYCENVARRLEGSQSASQELLLVAGASEEEMELGAVAHSPSQGKGKGKQRAQMVEEESEDDEAGEEDISPAASQENGDLIEEIGNFELDQEEDADIEGEEASIEQSAGEVESQDSSEEDEVVAAALGAVSPRSVKKSLSLPPPPSSSPVKPSLPVAADDVETQEVELSTQRRAQLAMFRQLEADSSESQDDEEDAAMQAIDHAAEFKDMRFSSDEEEDAAPATQRQEPNHAVQFRDFLNGATSDEEDEDEIQDNPLQPQQQQQQASVSSSLAAVEGSPRTRLGFEPHTNRLTRIPIKARNGPSMLDRQPDAERILFDSQGDSPVPTPKPRRTTSRKAPTATSSNPAPRPSRADKKGAFLGVEVPRRATRSASVEDRQIEVGRAASTTKTKRAGKSVVPVALPIAEDVDDDDEEENQIVGEEEDVVGVSADFGRFETDTFDVQEDFGGGDEEMERLQEAEFAAAYAVGGQEFALEQDGDELQAEEAVVSRTSKSSKGKGKGKGKGKARAKRPRSPSLQLDDEEEPDADFDELMAYFLTQAAEATASTSGQPSTATAVAPSAADTALRSISRSPPVAGPSRTTLATQHRAPQPSNDGPGFRDASSSEDEVVTRANRTRRRKEPEDEYDQEVLDFRPSASARSQKGKGEEGYQTSAARAREKKRARLTGTGRDVEEGDSGEDVRVGKRAKSTPKKHRRRRSTISADSDSEAGHSDSPPPRPPRIIVNRYHQGRNVTGRVPWTDREEQAFMRAMSEVGPRWQQIISLYGERGTSSTILKHRTVVSLKDKAVNIKAGLWRAGREVPWFLGDVHVSDKKLGKKAAAIRQAALAEQEEDQLDSD